MTCYPPVVSVTLYLRGDALDPAVVTHEIGIRPTCSQKKGNNHRLSSGQQVIYNIGLWEWEPGLRGQPVDIQMEALMQHFAAVKVRLRDLPGVEDAQVDLYAAYAPQGDSAGGEQWVLTERCLRFLTMHGLEFHVTISCDSE